MDDQQDLHSSIDDTVAAHSPEAAEQLKTAVTEPTHPEHGLAAWRERWHELLAEHPELALFIDDLSNSGL